MAPSQHMHPERRFIVDAAYRQRAGASAQNCRICMLGRLLGFVAANHACTVLSGSSVPSAFFHLSSSCRLRRVDSAQQRTNRIKSHSTGMVSRSVRFAPWTARVRSGDSPDDDKYFTLALMQRPEEVAAELRTVGFEMLELLAVEGLLIPCSRPTTVSVWSS